MNCVLRSDEPSFTPQACCTVETSLSVQLGVRYSLWFLPILDLSAPGLALPRGVPCSAELQMADLRL